MINAELDLSLDLLKNEIAGSLISPEDADYNAARQTWNLTFDQHPALILVAQNADDVALGIQYARANQLGVAVQATGHGVILPANDCLLILTSQLSDIAIDAEAQTARIEAGVIWSAVLEKSHPFGLIPLLGSSSGVGAISYTLGGGMGWLARKYGLATDSVLEFEIVTADGQFRRVNESENPDLFWALRGGAKGSMGVVTAMTIRLFPVSTVYAGSVIYPLEDAKEVFAFYRQWIQFLPVEWTSSISIMHYPPMPELPPFLSGRSVVMVTGCYCGDVNIGMMMAQAFADWKQPIVSTFHPMPMSESDTISNDPLDPMPGRSSAAWLTDLEDDTVDLLLTYAGTAGSPIMKVDVRYAGGAINSVDKDESAYDHRSSTMLMQWLGLTFTPEMVEQFEAYGAIMKQALKSHLTGGVYMNFLEGDEAHKETAKAFATEKYQRLIDLKTQYDPDNLFHFGYNIPLANK